MEQNSWAKYHQLLNNQSLPPAHTMRWCLNYIAQKEFNPIDQDSLAIDLGCGNGADTLALLLAGFRVLAIDKELEVLNKMEVSLSKLPQTDLQIQCITFEEISNLPECKLLNATFSLPFCHPNFFDQFWLLIKKTIREGGYFCGHFFGVRDSWKDNLNMTFHTYEQVLQLLEDFTVLDFEEVDKKGKTISGREKHWHVFHVVAQKK